MTFHVHDLVDGKGGRTSITATFEFGSFAKSQMVGFSFHIPMTTIEEREFETRGRSIAELMTLGLETGKQNQNTRSSDVKLVSYK